MTATAIAVQYIDIKAEDDVETEITPAEPVSVTGVRYESKGNNVYSVINLLSDSTEEDTGTLVLAGQDRDPEKTDDNNLLSGRTTEKGGSIEIEEIVLTAAEGGKADGRLTTEAYYTIKGAKSTYYVTAGSDGYLGTWDDVIKDSSSDNRLGTYNINADGNQQSLGWVFIKGSNVDSMLLATEYVLDNVVFNESGGQGIYSGSTLEAKMKEIYNNVGGSKTAIKQNQTISMADYTGTVWGINTCVTEGHTDTNGFHTGTSGCTYDWGTTANVTSEIKNQAAIKNITFFALSIEEMAKAYDGVYGAKYRRALYAECGTNNWKQTSNYEGETKIQSAYYWLRSPGYSSTYASSIYPDGAVCFGSSALATNVGARPACYATLA
jgi:hypothetical protein